MKENKDKSFDSQDSELAYDKLKYMKYKQKHDVINETNQTLKKDHYNLLQQNDHISSELKMEKELRKKYEQRLIGYFKNDKMNETAVSKTKYQEDIVVVNNERI